MQAGYAVYIKARKQQSEVWSFLLKQWAWILFSPTLRM